jgi:NADPH:quinone reductase
MKAMVCEQYGSPKSLQLRELPDNTLEAHEVRIAVRAAGVNFVDSVFIAGGHQRNFPTPFIPGGDIAGEITEVGRYVSGFQPGDRVLACPGIGGFADSITLSPQQLTLIPDGMSDIAAATFLQVHATSWYALMYRGDLAANQTVLILGAAGGTGIAAIHIAKAVGARVIAAASSEDKLAACLAAGADDTINYSETDLKLAAKELTGGTGVDIVFDPVGGELSEPALRACAQGARFLVVGFAAGTIPKIPLNLPLVKRCQIVGVDWGGSAMSDASLYARVRDEIVALYQQGKLPDPPFHRYSLQDTGQALIDLQNRRTTGKAVIDMSL